MGGRKTLLQTGREIKREGGRKKQEREREIIEVDSPVNDQEFEFMLD